MRQRRQRPKPLPEGWEYAGELFPASAPTPSHTCVYTTRLVCDECGGTLSALVSKDPPILPKGQDCAD